MQRHPWYLLEDICDGME